MSLPQTLNQLDGTEIAVLGMAGRFPGAKDVAAFWENLREGVESIKFFTDAELEAAGVDPVKLQETNFVKACGHLEGSDLFDAGFFGFSPMDAATMDPQHRVFLECAWEALEDAGYNPWTYPGAIGIFAGSGMNAYMMYNLISNPDLVASTGRFMLWTNGNDKDFLTTRVSYLLNLRGPSVNVQTACSTSLVAIHLASQSLLNSECDMAMAGGATILLPQDRGYLYREGEIMSPDGHCRAFDKKAKGTVAGSGAGIVVLKRLARAIKDGDNIYAVIKGSAINNDGSLKVGYAAPSIEGQAQVITEALEVAGVSPETISYVETHGTGTPIGDPIEIAALTRAFRTRTLKKAFCGVGSVKTNIGHLDTAAGITGFIKTVLALKHKELPPSLHYEVPNPEIDFVNGPFLVNAKLSKWTSNGSPRRAGVSSLGIGGTNAHLILEEAPKLEPSGKSRSRQLLLQSTRSDDALNRATASLTQHLTQNPELNLADVAYTLHLGRRGFNHRRMLVCRDRDDAVSALESLDPERVFTQYHGDGDRSVLFMFPGQGSQYVNMGRELYQEEPVFRRELDRCTELLESHLGFDLRQVLYPGEGQVEKATERLVQTAVAQPAIFSIEYALAKLWMTWGVQPIAMIGHSIGEYVAACLAGVFSLEDALRLVAARGRLMQQLPAGAMLVVSLSEEQVEPMLGEDLALAAVNGPSLCVISGALVAIEAVQNQLKVQGSDCRRLHASHAFHSKMMDPILEPFLNEVGKVKLNPPQRPYISNVTGSWITEAQARNPDYWVRHLRQTVRFAEGLHKLLETNRVLLEVGPGNALSMFARQQSAGTPQPPPALASLRHPKDSQSDTAFLLNTLGRLWLVGVRIDWSGFYADEQRCRVPLPTYPFERQRYWIDPGKRAYVETSSTGSLAKKPNVADWFYLPTWTETAPRPPSKSSDPRGQGVSWLVFADEGGFGSRLAERLEGDAITVVSGESFSKLNDRAYSIDPRRPADYDALLNELANAKRFPQKIAHCWNVTPSKSVEPEIGCIENGLHSGFYSLLYLAQALGRQKLSRAVHIGIISNGMQQVAGEALLHPGKATLLGPSRVIPQEFPNISCASIDITLPQPGCWREEKLIGQLISELSGNLPDAVIAYRSYKRWVQSFTPFHIDEAVTGKSLLRQGGTYLITGGLGGIALALAEHLARTIQAKLVLVGRRGLPPRNDWTQWLESHDDRDQTSVRIRKVQGLDQLGATVFIATADIADATQMRLVVDQAKDRFGGIQGVIHAAGLIEDGIIQLKSRETVERVLAPKVKGTLVLDAVLRDEKLDFFALFSSVSAISGPAGQVDYAAANAFLDAFAQQKAAKDGTYTLAINWGAWQGVGMAAPTAAQAGAGDVVVSKLADKELTHPLLGRCLVDSDDEKVYCTEFTDRHWVLDEHRFTSGEAVFPGTVFLELARAALEQSSQNKAVEIRDLSFLAPMVLRVGERRELCIALKRQGNSFQFVVSSRSGSGETPTHARGTIRYIDTPQAKSRSIAEIEARCGVSELASAVEQSTHVGYGPRWKNVKRVHFGSREALVTIELPEAFSADLEHYKLHPATLDMATGSAQALIRGRDRLEGFYVPLSYGTVRVHAPLPAKFFSYIRVRDQKETQKGIAVFDITILNGDGLEIVEISDFVVRRITDIAKMMGEVGNIADGSQRIGPGLGGGPGKPDAISQVLRAGMEQGITRAEGIDAFCRILSGGVSPQIIVSSQDVNALIDGVNAAGRTADTNRIGPAQPALVQHSRPELLTRFVPPGTELERKIAEIWQELLGIRQVGIHDDFFELGGHSLMIVMVHSRLHQALDTTFPVSNMFQYPTISSLANYLRQGQGDKPSYGNLRDRAERQREALVRQKRLVEEKSRNDR